MTLNTNVLHKLHILKKNCENDDHFKIINLMIKILNTTSTVSELDIIELVKLTDPEDELWKEFFEEFPLLTIIKIDKLKCEVLLKNELVHMDLNKSDISYIISELSNDNSMNRLISRILRKIFIEKKYYEQYSKNLQNDIQTYLNDIDVLNKTYDALNIKSIKDEDNLYLFKEKYIILNTMRNEDRRMFDIQFNENKHKIKSYEDTIIGLERKVINLEKIKNEKADILNTVQIENKALKDDVFCLTANIKNLEKCINEKDDTEFMNFMNLSKEIESEKNKNDNLNVVINDMIKCLSDKNDLIEFKDHNLNKLKETIKSMKTDTDFEFMKLQKDFDDLCCSKMMTDKKINENLYVNNLYKNERDKTLYDNKNMNSKMINMHFDIDHIKSELNNKKNYCNDLSTKYSLINDVLKLKENDCIVQSKTIIQYHALLDKHKDDNKNLCEKLELTEALFLDTRDINIKLEKQALDLKNQLNEYIIKCESIKVINKSLTHASDKVTIHYKNLYEVCNTCKIEFDQIDNQKQMLDCGHFVCDFCFVKLLDCSQCEQYEQC
jgi:hypothetical protein